MPKWPHRRGHMGWKLVTCEAAIVGRAMAADAVRILRATPTWRMAPGLCLAVAAETVVAAVASVAGIAIDACDDAVRPVPPMRIVISGLLVAVALGTARLGVAELAAIVRMIGSGSRHFAMELLPAGLVVLRLPSRIDLRMANRALAADVLVGMATEAVALRHPEPIGYSMAGIDADVAFVTGEVGFVVSLV